MISERPNWNHKLESYTHAKRSIANQVEQLNITSKQRLPNPLEAYFQVILKVGFIESCH